MAKLIFSISIFTGEACGKPSHVPYAKGGFEVTGLPEGVAFRKPSGYGLKQIRDIMKNAENVKFTLKEEEPEFDSLGQLPSTIKETSYFQILQKIVDMEKITACLSKHELIAEKDLEVDIDLMESEFNLLTTELSNHFETDAMTALVANYKISKAHRGYVLPVYTDTEEPYWLFYYPGTSAKIEGLHPEDKISGHWFDKTHQKLQYELLVEKRETFITALNLVCPQNKELGSLRLKRSITVEKSATINVSLDFDTSILACLKRQGFL